MGFFAFLLLQKIKTIFGHVVGTTLVGFGLVVWTLVVVIFWVSEVAITRRTTLGFVCLTVGWPVVVNNSCRCV